WALMVRRMTRMREHFIPPPVDPAQAPINIKITSNIRDSSGHRLKSAVAKPVVEITEATWKAAVRTASAYVGMLAAMFMEMMAVAMAVTARKKRSSSLFSACLILPVRTRKYRAKFRENRIMKMVMMISKVGLP